MAKDLSWAGKSDFQEGFPPPPPTAQLNVNMPSSQQIIKIAFRFVPRVGNYKSANSTIDLLLTVKFVKEMVMEMVHYSELDGLMD